MTIDCNAGAVAYSRSQCDDPENREKNDFYPTWPAARPGEGHGHIGTPSLRRLDWTEVAA